MKNSKIRNTIVAACLTMALAFSFAACSKDTKETEKETEETTTEATTAEETTEATTEETEAETEASADETEAEATGSADADIMPEPAKVEDFQDERLQAIVKDCNAEQIEVTKYTREMDPTLPESFVEGLMAMGGSLNVSAEASVDEEGNTESEGDAAGSNFKVIIAYVFTDGKDAKDYFDTSITGSGMFPVDDFKKEEKDDKTTYSYEQDGTTLDIEITEDGFFCLTEVIGG